MHGRIRVPFGDFSQVLFSQTSKLVCLGLLPIQLLNSVSAAAAQSVRKEKLGDFPGNLRLSGAAAAAAAAVWTQIYIYEKHT